MRIYSRLQTASKFTEIDSTNLKDSNASPLHAPDSVSDTALAGGSNLSASELYAAGLERQESSTFGAGQALETSALAPLEHYFQTDLSEVRIHTEPAASQSAAALDALAYTHGRDIYFAPGMYAPGSSSGLRLIAHEVAHVVQQGQGQGQGRSPAIAAKSGHGAKIAPADDVLEGEAERHAQQFMSGAASDGLSEEEQKRHELSPAIQRSPNVIQRQQAPPQTHTPSTTSLDATAQSILKDAQDSSRPSSIRAVTAVWRIIHEYYPSETMNVNAVTFDNAKAGTGLATAPYPAANPVAGNISVGDSFLSGVQVSKAFAHRVLQVGHELEHIRQFRDPALGHSAAK
jgi:Domain of unknown function (DUF4157)